MLDLVDKKYFKLAIGNNIGRETDVDISAKCPICGDSKIHANEKRLHLYSKNGITLVHCFNGDCQVVPQSLGKFLKFFYPDLYSSYRREKSFRNISNFKNTFSDSFLGSGVESGSDSEDIFKKIKSDIDKNKTNSVANLNTSTEEHIKKYDVVKLATFDYSSYFVNVKDSKEAISYLKSRHFDLNDIEGLLGDWYISKINMNIGEKFYNLKNCLIIPLYAPLDELGSKFAMYGFYSRSIESKTFYTFMPEENQGYKIWNYFNINKEEPVYIFEGIFDALSAYKSGLKNVIACMGATIPDERIRELKDPVFCLDNDKTGFLNTLKYCKKYKVLVLPDDVKQKDMNEILKAGLDVKSLIQNNIFKGIMAEIKIRKKL